MKRKHTFSRKTLEDLEFPQVLEQIATSCKTQPGREAVLEIHPLSEGTRLHSSLKRSAEYLSSFENDNRIPPHGFEPIDQDLELLGIENSILPIEGFRRFHHITLQVGDHQKFFRKFEPYYPELHDLISSATYQPDIPVAIGAVIDRFGEIRDNASDALKSIRRNMNRARQGIDQSFASALMRCQKSDYLDEIRESIVDNRRVLAVKAMYRRKVKGNVMGTSKTGSIVYIEPEASVQFVRELQLLELEEREEIRKILRALGPINRS